MERYYLDLRILGKKGGVVKVRGGCLKLNTSPKRFGLIIQKIRLLKPNLPSSVSAFLRNFISILTRIEIDFYDISFNPKVPLGTTLW